MKIQDVLQTHDALAKRICSGPVERDALPDFPLEPDYAYVLEHYGALDFQELDLELTVAGMEDVPRLELPAPPPVAVFAGCCYGVGTSYGGDEILQICVGRYKGMLAFVDHEVMDWDEIEDDERYANLASASEDERAQVFDAFVDEWKDEAFLLSELSVSQTLDKAFRSYGPSHLEYHRVRADVDRVYAPYVRGLVNSIEARCEEPDPELEAFLNAPNREELADEFLEGYFKSGESKDPEQPNPSSLPFAAMSSAEAEAVVRAYEVYVEPRVSLLSLSPTVFGFVNGSYWLRAIAYTLDAYLLQRRHESLRPHLAALKTLAKDADRKGTHVLSLRLIATHSQLGDFDEALSLLESTRFDGFKRDLPTFRHYLANHALFKGLRQNRRDRLDELLARGVEPYAGPGGVWGYHGSSVVEDLEDMPAFAEQELGLPPLAEGVEDPTRRVRTGDHHLSTTEGNVERFFAWEPTDLHPVFWKPGFIEQHGTFCGVTVHGASIYVVGGLGLSLAFESHDGGQSFQRMRLCRQVNSDAESLEAIRPSEVVGFRSLCIRGNARHIAAQHGNVLSSTDAGRSFATVKPGLELVNTVLYADGVLWATGRGAYRSSDEGKTWNAVDVKGGISRPQGDEREAILPSGEGLLYVSQNGSVRQTALKAPDKVTSACRSPDGTLLAAGYRGLIYRSTNDGASFSKVRSGVSTSLQNLVCLPGGVVIVVGEAGVILRSEDDGKSFERVPQSFTQGWLFGVAAFGDHALIAGAEGSLLVVR